MTQNPAAPIAVPASKQAALKALIQPPAVAWPTFITALVSFIGIAAMYVLALTEVLPLWQAGLLNVLFMYPLFGVFHDSIHRAVFRRASLNDWLARATMLPVAPYVSMGLFRWAHIQHHRFTNGAKDPDGWIHGPWWSLLFRWCTWDGAYLVHILTKGDDLSRQHLKRTLTSTAVVLVAAAALYQMGYGWHMLWLWLIPGRLTMLLFGFVFFWLPHVKHDVPSQDNLTLATSMRLGSEWLLNPLMQFHNYHLIHHIWPLTPAHNHPKVWKLMEPELRARDLVVQHGFAIQPQVEQAMPSAR